MTTPQDLCLIEMDDAAYAQAAAAAQAFRYGDDPAGFAFTGRATLVFHRTDAAWAHEAFSSQPLITHVHPMQGAPDAQDANDPAFLAALSERVAFLHVPAECHAMQVDDVWSIDCEFVMFAVPHPQEAGASAWLLVPGPQGREISSQKTLQDYQFAELQRAAQAAQLTPGGATDKDTVH